MSNEPNETTTDEQKPESVNVIAEQHWDDSGRTWIRGRRGW